MSLLRFVLLLTTNILTLERMKAEMDTVSLIKKLERPEGTVDAVLDTDAYNEIDDQFALSYMLRCAPKIHTRAVLAAPFFNGHSTGPRDGMEKSYDEIRKLLHLAGREDLLTEVYKGSGGYLPDESTPVDSPAARKLAALAMEYEPDRPLYVVAIGAITNVASAILLEPGITERIVVIWLGGHAVDWNDTKEFNMHQDIAAARVVFGCGVPLVQFPCMDVVSSFTVSEAELLMWLKGKNDLCDYLVQHTVDEMANEEGRPWSRVIWDVTAVSWLAEGRFLRSRLIPSPVPEYDGLYGFDGSRHFIRYVCHIEHDSLVRDLFEKLSD